MINFSSVKFLGKVIAVVAIFIIFILFVRGLTLELQCTIFVDDHNAQHGSTNMTIMEYNYHSDTCIVRQQYKGMYHGKEVEFVSYHSKMFEFGEKNPLVNIDYNER